MNRRKFLKYTGLTTGLLLVPPWARSFNAIGQTAHVPASEKKKLADAALNAATKKGAKYVDVRIGRYLNQSIFTREDRVENIVSGESYGCGVRVIADGAWGFCATDNVTPEAIAKAAEQAVAIAKANAKLQDTPVILAPQKGVGEVAWRTPIVKNAFEVPVAEKVALLMEVNKAALANGANFINSSLFQINEQKYFASTDGSYIDQDVHRIWPVFNVTGIDPKNGRFQTRANHSARRAAAAGNTWRARRAASGAASSRATQIPTTWSKTRRRPRIRCRRRSPRSRSSRGNTRSCSSRSHMWLTIHESVGHPTELDRVLGYEANYAGTSFATIDKAKSKDLQVRQRQGEHALPTRRSRLVRRGRLRRRRRPDQAVGHHQGRHPRELPEDARPGAHHGPEGERRLLVRRSLEQRAIPAHAERLVQPRARIRSRPSR